MMAAHDLRDVFLTGYLSDVSTAGQIYVPIPAGCEGEIIEARSALNGAITGADATLTLKIGGTAVTNGSITVTQSGSAAGDVDVCNPSGARTVRAGDAVEIETDGGSTGAVAVMVTLVIRR